MLERILMEVCQIMGECLDRNQMEKLKNTLFISFRGKVVSEEKFEISLSETDEDINLIKIFRASKIVSGRSEDTLKQYLAELRCCRATIGKKIQRYHHHGFALVFRYAPGEEREQNDYHPE